MQNAVATPAGVRVTGVHATGDAGSVSIAYRLLDADVTDDVPVVRRNGGWAVGDAAVAVRYTVAAAGHRLTLAGVAVPTDTVLLFPGAAPAQLDTSALQVPADARAVRFDGAGTIVLTPELSPAGRAAVERGVTTAVQRCLSSPDPSCPMPGPEVRIVPGTLSGSAQGDIGPRLQVGLGSDPDGRIDVDGAVPVRGRYQKLDFENQATAASGTVSLAVHAYCFATTPQHIVWEFG